LDNEEVLTGGKATVERSWLFTTT